MLLCWTVYVVLTHCPVFGAHYTLSRARQAWEQQQERNIEYVAYTRSKSALYFVEEGE